MDIWLAPLKEESETVLSGDEKVRAARFHFEQDRVRWTRAHSVLRLILSRCSGIPPLDLRFTTGPHGKPALASGGGIEFNLSHAGDWALIGVTRNVPIGVDIERIRENVNMAALLRRLGETDIPENQEALYRAWTRREATSKAAGGMLFDKWDHDFGVCAIDAPDGYCASVALIGYEPRVHLGSSY